ncbi:MULTISPECIES: MFS transporter [unclassified Frankia]|uniref:MFS transporter n=1 Tax=unclassified Frankia TaxID=2632575 RepID=UPI0009EA0361|nr:MFS transporter [Frankia sp. CcI6]
MIPFGGLLLFAGRLGDLVGAKRMFLAGIALFTPASLVCGLAQNPETLVAARFVQGVGGALAAAVVLGLVVSTFPNAIEQAKAIGLYAFVSSAGAALGLLLGAWITEALSWHWTFFINVPLGLLVLPLGARLVDDERVVLDDRSIDVPGVLLITSGLMLTVYTIVRFADGATPLTWALVGISAALLAAFVVRQRTARNPLVPLSIFRARNVAWANMVQALMIAGMGGMFFLGTLYLRQVLGLSAMEVGLAFLPTALMVAVISLKATPRLMEKIDPKTVLVPGLLLITAGLALLAVAPADGDYWRDVLPAMVLLGAGAGLGYPSSLTMVMADATAADRGLRSGLVNTTQQVGPAIGLAVLATVAADRTTTLVSRGSTHAEALTGGYHLAFWIGSGASLVALVLTVLFLRPAVPTSVPKTLDRARASQRLTQDHTGLSDPDFLALGLGGTNMMAMLWSVAMGRRAVGVELRGSPYVSVMRWTMREEIYHHLAMIDSMMLERYGEDLLPRLGDGRPFRLADCFFSRHTRAGSVRGDEVVTGFESDAHIGGLARHYETIDDRYREGRAHREINVLDPLEGPEGLDPAALEHDLSDVLGSQSMFQVGAEELLVMLRRYLEGLEQIDRDRGEALPRVRVLPYHRVATSESSDRERRWLPSALRRTPVAERGFERTADGRVRVRVEAVRELDYRGAFRRVRVPYSETVDLGTPGLIMIAEGLDSPDAARLGFRQETVCVDRGDGRGPVPAEADFLVGNVDIYLADRIRVRRASEFDQAGNEYWVHQRCVGHEEDAQIGWTMLEVPPYKTFDPIQAGLVPAGTPKDSKPYFAGHQFLLRRYFLDQTAQLTEIPRRAIEYNQLSYGPKLFTVTERIGLDALVAANAVVAGDSFGNSHHLTSGGINTGMLGHGLRVLRYWQARESGSSASDAARDLADGIRADTRALIDLCEQDFRAAPPAAPPRKQQRLLAGATRQRRSIFPQRYPDEWSRIQLRTGKIFAYNLPMLDPEHPDTREAQPVGAMSGAPPSASERKDPLGAARA